MLWGGSKVAQASACECPFFILSGAGPRWHSFSQGGTGISLCSARDSQSRNYFATDAIIWSNAL
jgi:hypothetical protein